ncbi:MAG: hypothetical protein SPI77_09615 [Corynebacterium sp.]|nr:hypothetical protein [Corynebacterium sp.]
MSEPTSEVSEDVVSVSPTPTFEAKEVSPITAAAPTDTVKDEGLNTEFTLYSVKVGPVSGIVVTVRARNLNDVPLPVDVLSPTYRYKESGGNNYTEAEVVETTSVNNSPVGLDVPLGPQAEVLLQYPYQVSLTTASDAQFTIGNVTFQGDLTLANSQPY